MPPKKKFSKEQIIEVSFEIARTEGIDSITIRKVAEKLGSSIAPIYVNFEDVEELKRAVVKKVVAISQQMIREQSTGNPFRDIGVASIRFAKDYSVLFRDLVMKQNDYVKDYDQDMGSDLISLMKEDPFLEGLTDEDLMLLLLKMRIFQMGLSVMVANRLLPESIDEKKMIELLDSTASDIITATKIHKS